MGDKTVYLDSSAIAKRYVEEEGSEAIDALYARSEVREMDLCFSLWNVGEVLGAIAKARRLRWLTPAGAETAAWSFVRESMKLRHMGALRTAPVRGDLLEAAITLLFRRDIEQADALQIATCQDLRASAFVSADRSLLEAARAEGLAALDPIRDAGRLRAL
jgi:predicted nucleic acid-binding protein